MEPSTKFSYCRGYIIIMPLKPGHYNDLALVRQKRSEYQIFNSLGSFDLRCESVTLYYITSSNEAATIKSKTSVLDQNVVHL